MKPVDLRALRVKSSIHLFPASGLSLCGRETRSSRSKKVAVDGLEDPAVCPDCRMVARGLSVSILS
jgi:hypothetical protein